MQPVEPVNRAFVSGLTDLNPVKQAGFRKHSNPNLNS